MAELKVEVSPGWLDKETGDFIQHITITGPKGTVPATLKVPLKSGDLAAPECIVRKP